MSSQWTNKYAIMRDLSLAQGCVPVDIQGIVSSEDIPPSLGLVEETEEHFFQNCVGDGELAPPDLGLIKSMLDMVRDTDDISDIEEPEKVIVISKLNPHVSLENGIKKKNRKVNKNGAAESETKLTKSKPQVIKSEPKLVKSEQTLVTHKSRVFKSRFELATNEPEQKLVTMEPKLANVEPTITETVKPLTSTKKPSRNIAMASFLESIGVDQSPKLLPDKKTIKEPQTLKQAISQHLGFPVTIETPVTKNPVQIKQEKTFDKVINWLETTEEPTTSAPISNKKSLFLINPSNMFKRKELPPIQTPTKPDPKPEPTANKIQMYKPSKWAEKYYKTYTERANMQVILNEDVWARAERRMKEIDTRRKLELIKFQESQRLELERLKLEEDEETQKAIIESAVTSSETTEIFTVDQCTDGQCTDVQSTDDQSTDIKSTDDQSTDIKSTDDQSTDIKSTDDQSTDIKSTDDQSTDIKSTDDQSTDIKSTDDQSTDIKSSDDQSIDVQCTDDECTGAMGTETLQETGDDQKWRHFETTLKAIRLSQHRHLLADPCVVCQVFCGPGTNNEE